MKRLFPARRLGSRAVFVLACLAATIAPLPAYYHFLHVREQDGQMRAAPERFDLRVLPDGAVPLVVSKFEEPELAAGDSWDAVLSEVKLAASVWSDVPGSKLRIRYAGETPDEPQAGTPYVQVIFEELPPGVIAMGGPVTIEAPGGDDTGEFVPIARSVVMVSHRLVDRPSYTEAFYMTLLHEMGHAIGLQHSFTGGVMSTGVTRAATKAAPLAEDDRAGIASLYPGAHFADDTGVLRGRVMVDGAGTHLAGVTALQPSGLAVSSLTLPDGSYEIRGLPPGSYYLYAQPLPPGNQEGLGPGQIVLPKTGVGETVPPGELFATRFYPDVPDWRTAYLLAVRRGGALEGIDFDAPRAESRAFTGVTTYSFPANFAVNPAVIDTGGANPFLVMYGPNLIENGSVADGLSVDALGAYIAGNSIRPYEPAPQFLRAGLNFHPFTTVSGTKPLLFSRNGETFVQPAGFRLVTQQPPHIEEIAVEAGSNGADSVRLRGRRLAPSFSYLFDGLVAAIPPADSSDRTGSEVVLRTPFTNDGRMARVTALTTDGQSSLYLDGEALGAATRAAPLTRFRVHAPALPAGAETMVEIDAEAEWFAEGRLAVSFNTPHVVARKLWRTDGGRLIANIHAMGASPRGLAPLWLHKDMAVVDSGAALVIADPDTRALTLDSRIIDERTGDEVIYPGAAARVDISGDGLGDIVPLRLGDRILNAERAESGSYRLMLPDDLPLGLTRLEAAVPGRAALPVAVEIAGQPPVITSDEVITRTDEAGMHLAYWVKLLVDLPGATDEELNSAKLTIRANGRLIEGVRQSSPSGRLIPLAFDIPSNVAVANTGQEQPAEVRVRIEWKGRHSAAHALHPATH